MFDWVEFLVGSVHSGLTWANDRDGDVVGAEPLAKARERHQSALAELPPHALQLSRGYPAIPTLFEPDGA